MPSTSGAKGTHELKSCAWIALSAGNDARQKWGVVERLSTGLLCTQVELQPIGHAMLAVADQIAN